MATTTNYSWTTPDNTDYVKDGASAIRTLGSSVDSTLGTALNNKLRAGLVLIKTQAITAGAASVTITDAFNTNFDNYKIIFSNIKMNGIAQAQFQMGTSNTGYYSTNTLGSASGYGVATGTMNFESQSNASTYDTGMLAGSTTDVTSGGNLEIQNAFLTASTAIQHQSTDARTNGVGTRSGSGFHNVATSYTSFTFLVSGTTFASGNIAVYGYAKD
jgi:hypothetical protein